MHGGVGGGGREADPYPDYQDQRRLPLMREQPTLAGVALSRMPQSRRVEETAVSNSIPRTKSSPKRSGEASGPAGPNPGDDALPGTLGTGQNVCPQCRGSGRRDGVRCQNCGGTGKVTEGIGGA